MWVTVWVRQIRRLKNRTNKRENRRKSHDFHRFLELVAGLDVYKRQSLDCDDGIEYSACLHEPTPQELLDRMELFVHL